MVWESELGGDNPKDFLEAADHMCRAMQRYQLGNPDAVVPGLPREDKRKIGAMLCKYKKQKKETYAMRGGS